MPSPFNQDHELAIQMGRPFHKKLKTLKILQNIFLDGLLYACAIPIGNFGICEVSLVLFRLVEFSICS